MFGVGLHFSVADLMAVRRIAIPGAIGQIIIATAIGAGMAHCGAGVLGRVWSWAQPFGREHGGVAEGARGAQRRRDAQRSHRHRLVDRRGPGDGSGAGAPAGLRGGLWRTRGEAAHAAPGRACSHSGNHLAKVAAFWRSSCWLGRACLPWMLRRSRGRDRANFSRCACWRLRWESLLVQPSSLESPSRLALSLLAWFCTSPT